MRITQMIIHSDLSQMKNEILPTCLKKSTESLGEYTNNCRMVCWQFRGFMIYDSHYSLKL